MKRETLIRIAVIAASVLLVVAVLFVAFEIYLTRTPKVKEFELDEYSEYIEWNEQYGEEFVVETVLGSVKNAKDAQKKADKLWEELYGECLKWHRPYKVSYDPKSDVWLVEGRFWIPFAFGGVPGLLIEGETGKVLAVWHGK